MFRSTVALILVFAVGVSGIALAADNAASGSNSQSQKNSGGSHHGNAAALAAQGQANAGLTNIMLMKAMSKTKDQESRKLMMMMMLQNMQQQAAFAQSARENKKNDSGNSDTKKEDDKSKQETPKAAAAPTIPEKPDEKLEPFLTMNPANQKKAGGSDEESSPTTISTPQIANLSNLDLKKPVDEKAAPAEKQVDAPAGEPSKSTPNAIADGKEPSPGNVLANANPTLNGGIGNPSSFIGVNPANGDKVNTAGARVEPTDTFANGASNERGIGRGDVSGYGDGGGAGGGDAREDNFFNSLLSDMMNPPAEGQPAGENEEVLPTAGQDPMPNIFEYATLRYQHAAQEEARVRLPQKKRAVTAEIR